MVQTPQTSDMRPEDYKWKLPSKLNKTDTKNYWIVVDGAVPENVELKYSKVVTTSLGRLKEVFSAKGEERHLQDSARINPETGGTL